MSGHLARIKTIEALLHGRPCIASSAKFALITSEFRQVYAVRKIRRSPRRRILEVLHSARALDTVLATFVANYNCMKNGRVPRAMGQYLHALEGHVVVGLDNLQPTHRIQFQTNIVDRRNTYLHEAGQFPTNDSEVDLLLAEMHSCLSIVVNLNAHAPLLP